MKLCPSGVALPTAGLAFPAIPPKASEAAAQVRCTWSLRLGCTPAHVRDICFGSSMWATMLPEVSCDAARDHSMPSVGCPH